MNPKRTVIFVSTNQAVSWGGSEVLWSEAAKILAKSGHKVAASVYGWPVSAHQLSVLRQTNIDVRESWIAPGFLKPDAMRKGAGFLIRQASRVALARWLDRKTADLICICAGSIADDISLMNLCATRQVPYVVVLQANAENIWPDDERAGQLIPIFNEARRNFFVSHRNQMLLETQLGVALQNSEVVRNPFNVRYDAPTSWPADSTLIKLACVGRLDAAAKGQDLLLLVLGSAPWKTRNVEVSFFGRGENEEGLKRLTARLGLETRVHFRGHVSDVEQIWATHHALVLPSRYEGLPLAVVEAMLCGRPTIVTDIAGNTELIEDGITGFVAEAPTEHHLHAAMERAWKQLDRWQSIGRAATKAARSLVPPDPASKFAQQLLELVRAS